MIFIFYKNSFLSLLFSKHLLSICLDSQPLLISISSTLDIHTLSETWSYCFISQVYFCSIFRLEAYILKCFETIVLFSDCIKNCLIMWLDFVYCSFCRRQGTKMEHLILALETKVGMLWNSMRCSFIYYSFVNNSSIWVLLLHHFHYLMNIGLNLSIELQDLVVS